MNIVAHKFDPATKARTILLSDGSEIPAKLKAFKTSGIFWQTKSGDWVKKIDAIRSGVELTGLTRRMSTQGQFTYVPA